LKALDLDFREWLERVERDEELRHLATTHPFRFLLKIGDARLLWEVEPHGIRLEEELNIDHNWDFTLVIPPDAWSRFCQPRPPRFHNTLQAMIAMVPGVAVEGSRLAWAQSAHTVERILLNARRERREPDPADAEFAPETITGRYVTASAGGDPYVMYYETAGEGHPVVFLHTAGSDSRQYKYLLGNRDLQRLASMYAFDLPYHGRSEPPDGWWTRPYRLTVDLYAEWIFAFLKAAGLYDRKPIICGSSMGGAMVLYLAANFGELFQAAISIEGGFGTAGRRLIAWTNHPQVHAGYFLPTWVAGTMSPDSPEYYRRLTLWQYAQGGPGVYQGDTAAGAHFHRAFQNIGRAKCPLWILSGEYDYSTTSEMSKEAAERMGGTFVPMEGIGHFPMSEHPKRFLHHFRPVLEQALRSR